MTATRINPEYALTTRTVSTTIKRTLGERASIAAPSVPGYTFVCWTNIATSGWCGALYAGSGNSPQTYAWLAAATSANGANGDVIATALYAKTA